MPNHYRFCKPDCPEPCPFIQRDEYAKDARITLERIANQVKDTTTYEKMPIQVDTELEKFHKRWNMHQDKQ